MNNGVVKNEFIEIGKIPSGWKMVKLHELGEKHDSVVAGPFGSNLKVSDYRDEGVPIIRLQNIERNRFLNKDIKYISEEKAKELQYHSFKAGDLLLAKLGDPIGKTCLVPHNMRNGIVVSDVVRVRVLSEKVITQFMEFVLNCDYCTKQLNKQTIGTTRPRVNLTDVRELMIALPPLAEQQKITSILSKVHTLIQKTDEIIGKTQRLKKSLMQRLLTQGIGHSKFKEIVLFPQYIHMSIPEEWNVVTFDDVATRITYGFTNPMSHTKEGPWLITAKDLKDGNINYHTAQKTSLKDYDELLTDKSRPKVGTVLITKDGTLGEVAIVDRNNICINQSVASIESKSSILPEFLALTLQSPYIKKVIDTFSPATTIRHISITDLAKWKFGLPPVNEQRRIISILSYADTYVQRTKSHKALLEDLKKGLMQKLLTGKIRVKV